MFQNWITDLKANFQTVKDWEFSSDDLKAAEVKKAIFIVALCMIPAAVIFALSPKMGAIPLPTENPAQNILTSPAPVLPSQVLPIVQFFGTPVQVIINGMLMSFLFLVGTRLTKIKSGQTEKTYAYSFRVMLRVMAVHPVLQCFYFLRFAPSISLLVLGYFASNAAIGAFGMSKRNARVYFGAIYFMFALLQLKTAL